VTEPGAPPPTAQVRRARLALGLAGAACIGYGGWGVLTGGVATAPADTARWLAGSVLGHDLLLAPLAAAASWLLARTVPATTRPTVQGGLFVAGSLTLVAVPVLAGRGGHGNASSNPLNYPVNLAVALAAVAAGTAVVAAIRAWLARRSRRGVPDS
jgi:hypothetical protein